MGFNSFDNRLYAVYAQQAAPALPRMIIINGDGTTTFYRPLPRQASSYNMGDVDEQGHFWGANVGVGYVQVDLATNTSLAGGTLVAPNTPQYTPYDWAYVPGGGDNLWSVGAATNNIAYLMRFDRTAKSWTTVGNFGALVTSNANVWGALYSDASGALFGSENTSGRIFRFNITAVTAQQLASGPSTSSNDGAHCLLSTAQ